MSGSDSSDDVWHAGRLRAEERLIGWRGEKGTSELLVLSQVILSMQLSFAVIPLVMFTSDKLKMGEFVNKTALKIIAWIISFIIIVLNIYLLYQTFTGK